MVISENILRLAKVMFAHRLDWERLSLSLNLSQINLSASKSCICQMSDLDYVSWIMWAVKLLEL